VSGGNTLFAVDTWNDIGLSDLLRTAANEGTVLCGGSAGAICWFSAGHSDSGDPESYLVPQPKGPWEYVRCPCLGILEGLVCPHYDRTQSNGVLRAVDFDAMLLRHPDEYGLTIDHWAALVVEEGAFRVLSLEGKAGSVMADGSYSAENKGRPGMWRKWVEGGVIQSELVPSSGAIENLIKPARAVVEDPRLPTLRAQNPIHSKQ
jgi:dipeptidase E